MIARPFQIDRAIAQFQPAHPHLVAEDQAQRRDPAVDAVGAKDIGAARPAGIGNAHALGQEFDRDRREIELEIPVHPDLPIEAVAHNMLERPLEEPPLCHEQNQPDREQDADNRGRDARGQGERAPAITRARDMAARAACRYNRPCFGRVGFSIGHRAPTPASRFRSESLAFWRAGH